MSSDYPGGHPPQYAPRQSHGPQQGAPWPSAYPANAGYTHASGSPGTPGHASTSGPASPMNQPPTRSVSDSPPPAFSQPTQQEPPSQPGQSAQRPPQNWDPVANLKANAPKRSRWPIVVSIVILLVLVAGGAVYIVGQKAFQDPIATANAFCTDLMGQKYVDAYGLLSTSYQARLTAKDFAQVSQLRDQLDGKVRQCGLDGIQSNGGFNLNLNPQNASFNAQVTRNQSYTGKISLVKQNGNWKIQTLDDALQGSDVGALATGNQFCQALASQDYAAVYSMFTPAYQQQIGSTSAYENGLKQVFGGGQFQITGCQPQLDTFTVTAQGDRASLSGSFDIKVTTDAGALTVPVPFKLAFARIAGSWKISDLEVVQSQG